jgi:hypothetical protein
MGIFTWSAHVRALGLSIVPGIRLVSGGGDSDVTGLTRSVMEKLFVGQNWGLSGRLVPNTLLG